MAGQPEPAPRVIKPLKLKQTESPLVAVTMRDKVFMVKAPGEQWVTRPADGFAAWLKRNGPGILVTNDSHRVTLALDREHADDPSWQIRVTIKEGMIAREDERVRIRRTAIGFLGFARAAGERRKNRYWHVLDPTVFLDDAKAGMPLAELALWAEDVQAWCAGHGIVPRATAGGLAGQLLRHPRFYTEPRRRVPGATNDKARASLPGNHYELRADRDRTYAAHYIDQASAHHYHALKSPVPNADVYALGHYRDLRDEPWCDLADIGSMFGLLRVRLHVPANHTHITEWKSAVEEYRPPWASVTGSHLTYLYTNELELAHAFGCRIEYVTAAWLSDTADPCIAGYARWALAEIADAEPERRDWLKRVLLTTYGLLAAKPDHFEIGFRRAKTSTIVSYPVGGQMMPFHVRRTSKPIHSRLAHVVQRGMIEASTRAESIRFANKLIADDGEHVLCIYGDGILVRTLPWRRSFNLLPEPWRVKATLTGLRFLNEQSFESHELVRLPGIPMVGRAKKALQTATI